MLEVPFLVFFEVHDSCPFSVVMVLTIWHTGDSLTPRATWILQSFLSSRCISTLEDLFPRCTPTCPSHWPPAYVFRQI